MVNYDKFWNILKNFEKLSPPPQLHNVLLYNVFLSQEAWLIHIFTVLPNYPFISQRNYFYNYCYKLSNTFVLNYIFYI